MKILHYSLGFPPYRSGGLTKFCIDLMHEQKRQGHDVALLWPGQINIINKKIKIKHQKAVDGVESFEIINPLPVSYDEGIEDIYAFSKVVYSKTFENFLEFYQPDVVHIHTFMGLHKEFVESCYKHEIRTVFSVHDFFTVCPKVTLFRNGHVCETAEDCTNCPKCNLTALSAKKIFLLQSPIYRKLKDSSIVKKLRKRHRDRYLSGETEKKSETEIKNTPKDYLKLRMYYSEMLEMISVVHYNSSVTKEVFERFFLPKNSCIIPITHGDIKDNRKKKEFKEPLRFSYLGPQSKAKGYYFLKNTLDKLWEEGFKFSLNLYFTPTETAPYMNVHGRYSYDELEKIFDETDLLICPSLWYETFGYTVLEALSYGVPVIVSENVGAKDIIDEGCGIVVNSNLIEELSKLLDIRRIEEINKSINNMDSLCFSQKYYDDIKQICYIK